MKESVTLKSKYLDIPQELRDRLINLHTISKTHKRREKTPEYGKIEEIEYQDVRQELKVVGIRTEESKRKIQAALVSLEETREYIKTISNPNKERRKEKMAEILKKEIKNAEEKTSSLEEKIKLALDKEKEENVLKIIQDGINDLSERMETIK